jgi:hypothetical protein
MNPTDEQQNIAEQRLNICQNCEHIGTLPLLKDYAYCKKCFCPLDKKVYSDNKNECPEKYWNV